MGPRVKRLSKSQDEALEIAFERDPAVVWTSNRNGTTFVAAGSASKLVELGLAVYPPEHRLRFDRIVLTDAGREEARARRDARPRQAAR